MLLIKTLSQKKIGLLLLFSLLFLAFRFAGFTFDPISPDAVNWHYRSEQFIVGLKHHQFDKTYQHYHPGVTLMWITGIPIELAKQLTNTIYDHKTFLMFHMVAKASVVLAQFALSLVVIYLLSLIIGFNKAVLFTLIFSLEPFLVGNSVLYHMDLLFTLFLFISLLLAYLYLLTEKYSWLVLLGLFLSLSFLTRSIGIGAYVFCATLVSVMIYYKGSGIKKALKYFAHLAFYFFVFTLLLFPALWDQPLEIITDIFSEGARIGVRNGHNQIYFEEETSDPGPYFYPLIFLIKTSPFLLLGITLYLLHGLRNLQKLGQLKNGRFFGLVAYLALFYMGYLVVMTFPTKKLDRYVLVAFPFFSLVAFYGYSAVGNYFKRTSAQKVYYLILFLLFTIFNLSPLIYLKSYLFTYTNPLVGGAAKANELIGQKAFGVGILKVKEKLISVYSSAEPDWPKVGMIDTKPLRAVYPNSKVFDIRVDGTSNYDIIVLAVNETFPEKIYEEEFKFDSTIVINGLDYWRFYVKN